MPSKTSSSAASGNSSQSSPSSSRPKPQLGILQPPEKPPGKRLGNILDGMLEKLGGQFGSSAFKHSMAIGEVWDTIAGEHAAYSSPGKLDTGAKCLHVIAKTSRHASVIRWDTASMLRQIEVVLGEGVVTEIFVLTATPRAEPSLEPALAEPASAPVQTTEG